MSSGLSARRTKRAWSLVTSLDDEQLVHAAFEQFWATFGDDVATSEDVRAMVLRQINDAVQALAHDGADAGEGRSRLRNFLFNARLRGAEACK